MFLMFRISIIVFIFGSSSCGDDFSEELFLKPLHYSHLYSYFQFTSIWDSQVTFQHSHLLPRSLTEVIDYFNVDELHLSLTEGQWRHEQWGYQVVDAAPGAELLVWFSEKSRNVDEQWEQLADALSGLFCASLNFIDSTNTIRPQFSFAPSGVGAIRNSTLVRYATLPRENVCTENLTPWKKLLPCDSKRGLSTLLNSGMIHNTNYHSLAVHYRKICGNGNCTDVKHELKQTVSLVYDLEILGGSDWSLRKLFGHGLSGACPLAQTSRIFVDISNNDTVPVVLAPGNYFTETSKRGGEETTLAVFHLPKKGQFINIVSTRLSVVRRKLAPPLIHSSRYVVGYGQELGGLVTEIQNNHWEHVDVVFLENLPWWMPIHLSTLKVKNQNENTKVNIFSQYFSPGRSRLRPYHLEVGLRLPARSLTTISIEFDYVFLKWQEYPPDANHGFYIGSAVITAFLPNAKNYTLIPIEGSLISSSFNSSRSGYTVVFRTRGATISLPTPDFSMPYNVICLACTVVAVSFGPLHNITTKRLGLKKPVSNATKFKALLQGKKIPNEEVCE